MPQKEGAGRRTHQVDPVLGMHPGESIHTSQSIRPAAPAAACTFDSSICQAPSADEHAQSQLPLMETGGGAGGGVDPDRGSTVGVFARAPQYCGARATDFLPSLGTDTSSTTQTVGVMSELLLVLLVAVRQTGGHDPNWLSAAVQLPRAVTFGAQVLAWHRGEHVV